MKAKTKKSNKLHVGQRVFLKPVGNAARYDNEIETAMVSKVGRKYFYLDDYPYYRFHIDTMEEGAGDYMPRYAAYLSMKEIKDEQLVRSIEDELRSKFRGFGPLGLSLHKLKKIKEIFDEP